MNLNNLSDQNLLERTQNLAAQEREILTLLLHHLREIERRRLSSSLKYPSLLEYAVRELKYSEPQAIRRISAMRLMRDLPQVEEQIQSGELSLTNAVLAQSLFAKEKKVGRPMDSEQKAEVLQSLSGKTTRQAEKIVAEISPEMKKKSARLDYDMIEDEALREKLLRLKGRLAHSAPNVSLTDLLHKLCDAVLTEKVPQKPRPSSLAEIYRQVRKRGQCDICRSTYALEVDHIVPRALGGGDNPDNLRLLCRACNQRAAVEHFGPSTMAMYLDG